MDKRLRVVTMVLIVGLLVSAVAVLVLQVHLIGGEPKSTTGTAEGTSEEQKASSETGTKKDQIAQAVEEKKEKESTKGSDKEGEKSSTEEKKVEEKKATVDPDEAPKKEKEINDQGIEKKDVGQDKVEGDKKGVASDANDNFPTGGITKPGKDDETSKKDFEKTADEQAAEAKDGLAGNDAQDKVGKDKKSVATTNATADNAAASGLVEPSKGLETIKKDFEKTANEQAAEAKDGLAGNDAGQDKVDGDKKGVVTNATTDNAATVGITEMGKSVETSKKDIEKMTDEQTVHDGHAKKVENEGSKSEESKTQLKTTNRSVIALHDEENKAKKIEEETKDRSKREADIGNEKAEKAEAAQSREQEKSNDSPSPKEKHSVKEGLKSTTDDSTKMQTSTETAASATPSSTEKDTVVDAKSPATDGPKKGAIMDGAEKEGLKAITEDSKMGATADGYGKEKLKSTTEASKKRALQDGAENEGLKATTEDLKMGATTDAAEKEGLKATSDDSKMGATTDGAEKDGLKATTDESKKKTTAAGATDSASSGLPTNEAVGDAYASNIDESEKKEPATDRAENSTPAGHTTSVTTRTSALSSSVAAPSYTTKQDDAKDELKGNAGDSKKTAATDATTNASFNSSANEAAGDNSLPNEPGAPDVDMTKKGELQVLENESDIVKSEATKEGLISADKAQKANLGELNDSRNKPSPSEAKKEEKAEEKEIVKKLQQGKVVKENLISPDQVKEVNGSVRVAGGSDQKDDSKKSQSLGDALWKKEKKLLSEVKTVEELSMIIRDEAELCSDIENERARADCQREFKKLEQLEEKTKPGDTVAQAENSTWHGRLNFFWKLWGYFSPSRKAEEKNKGEVGNAEPKKVDGLVVKEVGEKAAHDFLQSFERELKAEGEAKKVGDTQHHDHKDTDPGYSSSSSSSSDSSSSSSSSADSSDDFDDHAVARSRLGGQREGKSKIDEEEEVKEEKKFEKMLEEAEEEIEQVVDGVKSDKEQSGGVIKKDKTKEEKEKGAKERKRFFGTVKTIALVVAGPVLVIAVIVLITRHYAGQNKPPAPSRLLV